MCAFVLGEYAAVKQQSCLIIAAAAAGLWLLSAAWRTKKRPPPVPALLDRVGLRLCAAALLAGFMLAEAALRPTPLDSYLDRLQTDSLNVSFCGQIDELTTTQYGMSAVLKDAAVKDGSGTYSTHQLLLYLEESQDLKIGYEIEAEGKLKAFESAANFGQFDFAAYYRCRGIDYQVQVKRWKVIGQGGNGIKGMLFSLRERAAGLLDQAADGDDAGVLKAMLLGDKSALPPEVRELFQISGIAHVLAVSGLHVSLLGMAVYRLLRKCTGSFPVSGFFGFTVTALYGMLTGSSGSAVRAVVMFGAGMLANVLGRTYDMLSATGLAAILLLAAHPMLMFDAGFQLSFTAVAGIGCAQLVQTETAKTKKEEREGVKKEVKSAAKRGAAAAAKLFQIPLALQAAMLPVLAWHYFQFPLYGILLNLLILPLMSMLVYASAAAMAGSLIFLPLGTFLVGTSHYILAFYESACRFFLKLPGAVVLTGRPAFWQVALYYLILMIWLMFSVRMSGNARPHIRASRHFLLLLLLPLLFHYPERGFTAAFLDVGQGDSIVMELPKGAGVVTVDGGSSSVSSVGEKRLIPYLLARRCGEINYALVTHGDADHYSAVMELLDQMAPGQRGFNGSVRIRCLLLAGASSGEEAIQKMVSMAEEKGVEVGWLTAGDRITAGDTVLTCLHPGDGFEGETNEASVTLSVEYDGCRMLLTGDLEGRGEEAVCRALKGGTGYDVLKAAHHGSKGSTSEEFLAAVRPALAVISCGRNNAYGHPHRETLDRLEAAGCCWLSTAESGAVYVRIRNGKIWAECELPSDH